MSLPGSVGFKAPLSRGALAGLLALRSDRRGLVLLCNVHSSLDGKKQLRGASGKREHSF